MESINHKTDLSDYEVDPTLQLDLILSDFKELAEKIINQDKNEAIDALNRVGLYQYIRGIQDGFRLYKKSPYPTPKHLSKIA